MPNRHALLRFRQATGAWNPHHALSGVKPSLWYSSNMATVANGAAHFQSSSSQYLSISDNASLSMGTGVHPTFSGWVYLDSATAQRTILSKWNTSSNKEYEIYYDNSASRFKFSVSNDGSTATTVTASTFGAASNSTWYFITAYYDGVHIGISVNNGAFDTTSFSSDIFDGTANFNLGAENGASFMDGRLDSWGIWKRVITASEITYLYNSGSGRSYVSLGVSNTDGSNLLSNLVAWWDLTPEVGIRPDMSGNSNHLNPSTKTIISNSPATLNGGFETAGAGGADVFGSWAEITGGTSTVNSEASIVHSGSAACRLDIDSSGSIGGVQQTVLTVGNYYRVSFWAKADSTSGSPTIGSDIANSGASITPVLTTSYTQYETVIKSIASIFNLKRGSGCANRSLYIDDIVVTDIGPVGIAGISDSPAIDANFSAQFNGSTQYLSIADASQTNLDPGTSDFSISAFLFVDRNVATAQSIISKGATANTNSSTEKGYNCFINSSGNFDLRFGDGSANRLTLTTTTAATVGVWSHVVWSFTRAGNVVCYVNGNSVGSTDISGQSGDVNSADAFAIASGLSATQLFAGRIDSVGFWSKALSASEVTSLFNKGIGLKYRDLSGSLLTSLVSYWNLDKRNGITADSAGSNTLTNTGSTGFGVGVNFYAGVLSKWFDRSANGKDATQTTNTKRPAYVTFLQNNKPMILYDGVDDVMSFSSTALSTTHTAFIIVRPVALTGVLIGGSSTNQLFSLDATNVTYNAQGTSVAVAHGMSINTTYLLTVVRNGTTVKFYKNGTQIGTDKTLGANSTLTVSAIGAYSDATSPSSAYIANPIVYGSALSNTNRSKIEKYLNRKYAIY